MNSVPNQHPKQWRSYNGWSASVNELGRKSLGHLPNHWLVACSAPTVLWPRRWASWTGGRSTTLSSLPRCPSNNPVHCTLTNQASLCSVSRGSSIIGAPEIFFRRPFFLLLNYKNLFRIAILILYPFEGFRGITYVSHPRQGKTPY